MLHSSQLIIQFVSDAESGDEAANVDLQLFNVETAGRLEQVVVVEGGLLVVPHVRRQLCLVEVERQVDALRQVVLMVDRDLFRSDAPH
jgi:hypothetical protein